MIKRALHIILFFCFLQQLYPQNGDGVVAFDIPVRNSLKFNRHIINPTFSFVREQNKYLSFNNKREWVQFDDAPQTYLFGYAGRFDENIGAGLSLFQQNYGVMTTFGGVANFAYNAVFDRESNLTFGLNLGFYKSGINEGNVVTNFPDSSLDDVPSHSVITVNPGINYGTGFFDFGVSINNLVSYNLSESKMIEDNPKQGIQGHIMYTGYVDSRGFFDESRFTGLLRSEFRKEETIIAGTVMLMVPKGIWAQAGYNTLYGMSAGLGLNITSQIAIEYNYENAMGDLSSFGNSHDITVAYKFKNRYRYSYNGDDDEQALLIPKRKTSRRTVARKRVSRPQTRTRQQVAKTNTNSTKQSDNVSEFKNEEVKEEQARLAEEARAKAEQEEQARLAEEARAKAEQEEQARLAEEARAKAEQEEQVRLVEEARAKAEQEEQARLVEEARAKAEQEEQVRLVEEARAKAEQEEQVRLVEEARAKAEQEEQARLVEVARVKAEQEEQTRLDEEARVKAEQEEQVRLAEAARIKAEQEEQARLAEAARVKAEQEEQARLAEAARVKAEKEEQARLAEEARVKAEQEEQARLAEEARVKAEQEEQARLAEEARVKAEQEEHARLAEEAKAKSENEEDPKIETEQLEPIVVDAATQEMSDLAKSSTVIETEQQALLEQLVEKVAIKQKDLEDLKKENDLSEQGIYQEPKAFKSVSAENAALEALKAEMDNAITIQNEKISELEALYQDRFKKTRDKNDTLGQSYLKTISSLKQEQAKIVQSKEDLYTTLSEIKVATEIERKRRIKRALYDNQEDRYNKDRAALQRIKKFTKPSDVALTSEDFDSGEELSNIQIVKDVAHADKGYYLVVAVHSDVNKRDDFLTKAVAAGRTDINFFFDVNTSKYYIYYEKFDDVNRARLAIENKGTEPYNSKMSMVKIEK
ncbi:PorP/SprF family type IX secretion system membrane protein [Tamlana crocina]|uniref:PorP/SprF family type IX secretion system membrane protein n=1 Tax=Tamlana crocina TaxID=393006 RepID=A0ABX1DF25_9FLAO|nr:type IX secretion system membrane protein PorP/SprF [Tamlana crocina]NJX15588.1 PorP/SprF family type IX secretion system membrane protein [Tamlana crocina]